MYETIKGWFDPQPMKLIAKPGLMTILDLALYRSVEGELTASVCAAHALLRVWIDMKQQAQDVLQNHDSSLVFARHCLEAACDAIEKLSTDRFAVSANLSDAYETPATSFSSATLSGQISIIESVSDTGRRMPNPQRRRDCWETARLICPDHVWADDAFLTGQRLIRVLTKYLPDDSYLTEEKRPVKILVDLVRQDLKMRLHQFRVATESNAVVLKRLYLVKCEFRAPFRAFLEAHQTVQRAPSLDLVQEFMEKGKTHKRHNSTLKESTTKLQKLLENPKLVEALHVEELLEGIEQKMAQGIFAFTEVARLIDCKKAKLKGLPGILEADELQLLQDLLRRLKCCLCRKISPETSTGIRPILLDLQGVPRDEAGSFLRKKTFSEGIFHEQISTFLKQLQKITTLCQTRHAFTSEQRRGDSSFDVPSSLIKECTKLDCQLWEAYCLDWFDLVRRQNMLSEGFDTLSEEIRQAEMEASIRAASAESLGMVRDRLERLTKDRELRWEVLQDMVEEVCAREMNW
eukprot:CAMPEP_0194199312 /NCGR_PEP_ID=MMETSP0156-20130528/377_1 /TAXON_ID=33649 /ORGANISM="Thalassionema nitzschioides, Strain L26-B" /LENGTH=518 /DNA_ID=CAMNT_0038924195 /DNA_START=52 /DNA_END=1605 /DNA_ORIENTATION=-